MEAKTYNILQGPGVLDLSISLFRRDRGDKVWFMLNDMEQAPACYITGAQSTDDSSASGWNLCGFFNEGLVTHDFTAKYSTFSRKGTFTVLKPKKS